MDHQSPRRNESAPFSFPESEPVADGQESQKELADSKKIEESAVGKAIERGNLTPLGQTSSVQTDATDFPLDPVVAIPVDQPTPGATSSSSTTIDLPARDVDLIEKAWVLKAKAMVERTRNDPHKQNNEINKIKADYQKKRYNRDLKINVE